MEALIFQKGRVPKFENLEIIGPPFMELFIKPMLCFSSHSIHGD